MRRRIAALAAAVVLAFAGGALVATAEAPADACDSVYTSNTIANLKRYDDCRFDRIERQLSQIQAASVSPSVSPTPSVTLSPSPTASPSRTPSPSPSLSSTTSPGFPDTGNTGVPAGTTLTPSGGLTITSPGTVIEGKDITGPVVVRAANVTIRDSRIKGSGGAYCVLTQNGGTVTLEDSEIVGGCENGIGFDGWTAKRVEVRGTYGDGVKLGSDVLLQDSWIHDLAPAAGAHADGGQVQGGVTNTVVRHNTIDLGSTPSVNAALFLAPDQGPSTNGPLVVDSNRLSGGNYIVFCVDGNNGQFLIRNISFTGNRFGDKFTYGRSNVNVPISQSGNVIDSTGAAYTL